MLETCLNDRDETRGVRRLFGLHLFSPQISQNSEWRLWWPVALLIPKHPCLSQKKHWGQSWFPETSCTSAALPAPWCSGPESPSRHCLAGLLFPCSYGQCPPRWSLNPLHTLIIPLGSCQFGHTGLMGVGWTGFPLWWSWTLGSHSAKREVPTTFLGRPRLKRRRGASSGSERKCVSGDGRGGIFPGFQRLLPFFQLPTIGLVLPLLRTTVVFCDEQ